MRNLRPGLLILLFSAAWLHGDGSRRPVSVIIIGVTSSTLYKSSNLGDDIKPACTELKRFFDAKRADVIDLCIDQVPTFQRVSKTLKKYFDQDQRGRMTLLFFMGHGEVAAPNNDVRLVMSDTTEAERDDSSIKLRRDLLAWIRGTRNSTTLAFIDACHAGEADSLEQAIGALAAQSESASYIGVMAAATADQSSYAIGFTRALIKSLEETCVKGPDDRAVDVYSRMQGSDASTPRWLIQYTGSTCFNDLFAKDKRLLSVWRSPKDRIVVRVQDENGNVLRKIPSGNLNMPWMDGFAPGFYNVIFLDESDLTHEIDRISCYLDSEAFCEADHPRSLDSASRALVLSQVYEGAKRLGYSSGDLEKIASEAALSYTLPKMVTLDVEDSVLFRFSPDLAHEVQLYQVGKKIPYRQTLRLVRDKKVQDALEETFRSIAEGNDEAGMIKLTEASDQAKKSKTLVQNGQESLVLKLDEVIKAIQEDKSVAVDQVKIIPSAIQGTLARSHQ